MNKMKFKEKSYEEIYHYECTIRCGTKALYSILFEINGKIREFNESKYQTQIPNNEERIDVTKKNEMKNTKLYGYDYNYLKIKTDSDDYLQL